MSNDILKEQNHPLYLHASKLISDLVLKAYPDFSLEIPVIYNLLSPAPNLKLGHLAFPCFPLAKALKSGPPQIAKNLETYFEGDELFSKISATGPYLNLTFNISTLAPKVINDLLSGKTFEQKLLAGDEKWMIEYSQPNTHKELHVGHMRNLCLGNALTRIARYAKVDMTTATYPGDMGTHVAKCLWYFKKHNTEPVPKGSPAEKGAWLGRLYTMGNNLLEDQLGSELEEQNRKELTTILHQLHDKKGEYYELWKETKEWSFKLMEKTYQWADVEFDRWFTESEMDAPSLAYAKKLQSDGLFKVDDGAVGIDLSDDKLGFCLMIKSDGTGLYATKDIELARKKFEEFGIDRNIYVVDNRQAHHFKQVFKVLEKIGFEKAKNCSHLQYAMVELPDGAMSSRKGNIVPLMELVSQMENLIKEKYLDKYLENSDSGWTKEEVEKAAFDIAAGAIKYGMVRVDNNRKIVFNMDDWLKLDGETGPYLQYVHARIASIESKLSLKSQDINYEVLTKDQEAALLLKLVEFNNVVATSAVKSQTVGLCSYLFELGKLFNSFYAECSINKAESEELSQARLALAMASRKVIEKGLEVLGIQAPQKM